MRGGRRTHGRVQRALVVVIVAWLGASTLAGALTPQGRVVTVAGNGEAGYAGDGGPGTVARLSSPSGLAVDGQGLLIVDAGNHVVRRLSTTGVMQAVAGARTPGAAGDGGPATEALLQDPRAVAVRPNGEVFVADTGNHRIRRVDRDGTISAAAGTGTEGDTGEGIPAHAARLSSPSGVAVRPNGDLVIADTGNHRLRAVGGDGRIVTVAGTGVAGFAGDGGPAVEAQLNGPAGVVVQPNGTMYVADTGNHRLRRIDVHGIITTVAGTGTPGWTGDGGSAAAATLHTPTGVSVTSDGGLLVADTGNHVVRWIAPNGTIRTVMGTGSPGDDGDGGVATASRLRAPRGAVEGPNGELYVADTGNHRVRTVVPRPATPSVSQVTPESPANDNHPVVRGAAESDTTVRIHDNADCAGPSLASGSAAEFATDGITVPVPDDSETRLHAVAVDTAGQVSPCSTSSVTYVEDSTPPGPPVITSRPDSPAATRTVTWAFTTPGPSTTCSLRDGAGVVVAAHDDCRSPWSVSLSAKDDDTFTLRILARDQAGNISAPAVATHQLDTTPPGAPTLELLPPASGFEHRPQWRFAAEAGATTTCRFSGPDHPSDAWAPCTSPWSTQLAEGAALGPWTLEVRATDAAGNTGPARSLSYTAAPPAGNPDPDPEPAPEPSPVARPAPAPSTAPVAGPAPPVSPAPPPAEPTHDAVSDANVLSGGTDRTTSPRDLIRRHDAAPVDQPSPPTPVIAQLAQAQDPAPTGLAAIADVARRLLPAGPDEAAFPVVLILLVLFFLAVQDQLDRRDPKLAQAPLTPTDLTFPDHPRSIPAVLPRPWVASQPLRGPR